MALVCPVGHPAGVGTSFCRLCGRDYVEVEDVPATGALAMIGAPGEAVGAPAAPAAPAVLTPPPPPAPSVLVPPPAPAVPAQGLPTGPPVEVLAPVVPMPPSAAPLPPVPSAPVPDVQPFPPVPVETGAHTVELPLVAVETVVPAQAEAPEVENDEPVSAVKAAVDRTVLLAATGAGFAGGAVAGALLHSLLG